MSNIQLRTLSHRLTPSAGSVPLWPILICPPKIRNHVNRRKISTLGISNLSASPRVSGFVLANPELKKVSGLLLGNPELKEVSGSSSTSFTSDRQHQECRAEDRGATFKPSERGGGGLEESSRWRRLISAACRNRGAGRRRGSA